MTHRLPELRLTDWNPTRDTLHQFARIIGKLRGRYMPKSNWVDAAFKTFKGGLREETGPVQIFPHHMDLSMNWFSGRLVPGVDPADEENADEQLNFGFVTGEGRGN